jgi:hypothetical protein
VRRARNPDGEQKHPRQAHPFEEFERHTLETREAACISKCGPCYDPAHIGGSGRSTFVHCHPLRTIPAYRYLCREYRR